MPLSNIPAIGQKVAAKSLAVTMASDQYGLETISNAIFSTTLELGFAGTAENNFLLIRNPAASGKYFVLHRIVVDIATKGNQATCRIYQKPTSVTPGTAITPINRFIGSAVTSVMTASSSPTATSSAANKIATISGGKDSNSMVNDYNGKIVLQEGQDLLVTSQQSATNTVVAMTVIYAEITIAQ